MLNVDIRFSPSFAMATVKMNQGESLQAKAGAMTGMSGGVEIATKAQGGILGGLKRSVLGGETFFINTFHRERRRGRGDRRSPAARRHHASAHRRSEGDHGPVGLVARGRGGTFTGPGKVWQQSRSPQDLIGWLTPKLPFSRSGS